VSEDKERSEMSSGRNEHVTQSNNLVGLGMLLGMIIGVALGVALWLATGNPALFAVFIGAGMCIGLAVGAGVDERKREHDA
jgi:ABC-type nitrate/sulfonate/bicarbonate transport system permease component